MNEKAAVIAINVLIIALVLFFANSLGTFFLNLAASPGGFNFYKANISINGQIINETIYFSPDRPYHTLFRNFTSSIVNPTNGANNTISISSVSCSAGTPYYRTQAGACYTFEGNGVNNQCLPNTDSNEYGCTFGNLEGFDQTINYSIGATYSISSTDLFSINGTYYIKFVPYSPGRHDSLELGNNLFVDGGVAGPYYPVDKAVVIYIPYTGNTTGFNIIKQDGFGFYTYKQFESDYLTMQLIMFLIPLIVFDLVWLFFGKKKKEPAVPSQLSDLPNERKPWQVSAYFTPPFLKPNKNFYATLLLDFYRRKIIDINCVDEGIFNKKTLVKLNNAPEDLDDVEKGFFDILTKISQGTSDKDREGEYFNIDKATGQFLTLKVAVQNEEGLVEDDGEKFIKGIGAKIFPLTIVVMLIVGVGMGLFALAASAFILIVVYAIVQKKTPLLIQYNEDFYEEYEQWMAFKNGLSHLHTIKNSDAKAIVLFEKYLVYATALGVAEIVLKELEGLKMVDEKMLRNYSRVYTSSYSFAGSFATTRGAFGGGGGIAGGVGGGGGSGR